ncbi:hypothetical protein B9G69_017190 [Bdellovibrio sp. SKB1291214]|uniref:hypothetical protein n=1 Tax=Bdellovibrio sp. SKB1291214 TaxID=1732569 RepID=UPI000B51C334|nr:hypothetical protein [Bdellovibrio sp. SKB1291214]UYL08780.1 hypothetical protein B9G69_017190 [Bdellovibrio sp. SKB1291214]
MKALSIFISTFVLSLTAQAKMPVRELDSLKQIIIVTRVAINDPSNPIIKKCNIKIEGLEERLQHAKDNAKKSWSKQTVDKADLPLLSKAIHNCSSRLSCEVYDSYITSVMVPENLEKQVEPLKIVLDTNLQVLKPEAYKAGVKTVKNPCTLLKAIIK